VQQHTQTDPGERMWVNDQRLDGAVRQVDREIEDAFVHDERKPY
jgi:hypothetical protein